MSKDQAYTAIVLKKTQFNEADEIITFYTKELGKVRGVAKSVKLAKSKLQHSLQGLFLVKVVFADSRRSSTQSALKKIIRCEVLNSHSRIRENLPAAKAGLFASEAVFRSTPDEQINTEVFELLKNFLAFLSQAEHSEYVLQMALAKFQLLLLKYLGHEILFPKQSEGQLYFSNSFGGFGYNLEAGDRVRVSESMLGFSDYLLSASIGESALKPEMKTFADLLSNFLEYQIERKLTAKNL